MTRSQAPGSPGAHPVTGEETRPVLRVVRGDATPEELAALVAVLAAAGGSGDSEGAGDARRTSQWSRPGATLRLPLHAGPGAWRHSAWPTR